MSSRIVSTILCVVAMVVLCDAYSYLLPTTRRSCSSSHKDSKAFWSRAARSVSGEGEVLVEELYEDTDIDENGIEVKSRRPELLVSSSLDMPFSADSAFDAFSDLTRQPSWSSWLRSVEYLEEPPATDGLFFERGKRHYGKSKWTVGVRGFQFSWEAITTVSERPHLIEWESISGLKNRGRVEFEPKLDGTHIMKLQMAFVAPRFAWRFFRKSSSVVRFVERKMLKKMLGKFRTVVLEDIQLRD